jgi:UDP-glucose 4-epimerase
MKITVWGGSGFLGSHVADTLTKQGHTVTIADSNVSQWLVENQEMIQGNVLDKEQVLKSVNGADVVFNFSGIADIQEADLDPNKSAEVNILGNLNLMDACVKHGVQRYIFASSLYVYSTSGGFYRCSKQACENYIDEFHRQRGLDYTILRFGSLYGPRSDEKNAIYRFIESAIKKKKINYWGKPDALRDYVHIHDAAQVCAEMLDNKFKNENIIISGTQTLKVSDVMEIIVEILGKNIALSYDEKADSGHYEKTPYSFTPKMAKKFVPRTQIDFGQGLLDMVQKIYKTIDN